MSSVQNNMPLEWTCHLKTSVHLGNLLHATQEQRYANDEAGSTCVNSSIRPCRLGTC